LTSKGSGFALRMDMTVRRLAVELARNEGLSINQFILLAVVEKIGRLETKSEKDQLTGPDVPGFTRRAG
jgi:hypothetical protein